MNDQALKKATFGIAMGLIFFLGSIAFAREELDRVPHFFKLTKGDQQVYVLGTIHIGISLDQLPSELIEDLAKTEAIFGEQSLDFYLQSLRQKEAYAQDFRDRNKNDCRSQLNLKNPVDRSIFNLIEMGVPGSRAGCKNKKLPSELIISFAKHIFSDNPQGALDAEIINTLAQRGLPTVQLETIEELNHFRSLQEKRAQFTRQLLGNPSEPTEKQFEGLTKEKIDLLFGRAVNTIVDYILGRPIHENEYDFDQSDYALQLRTKAWVKKILGSRYKDVGVVIGYRHLYGRAGFLELLRRKGFEVTPLYRFSKEYAPAKYKPNNEFAHISSTKLQIQQASCMKDFKINPSSFEAYYREALKSQKLKVDAVGGTLFKKDSTVSIASYRLLTSRWNYKLLPVMDIDFWNNLDVRNCEDVLCAAKSVFGQQKGALYLGLQMKTGINLSHLGYDRMKPPLFGEEKTPSPKTIKAFKAFYVPKEWDMKALGPYLKGLFNLPDFLFPLPYARLLRSEYENHFGDHVHSNAVMTMYPAMEDLDEVYQMYTLVHEIGHLIGTKYKVDSDREWIDISWKVDPKSQHWIRSQDQERFVSPYAMKDFFEDFAESFATYRLNPETLKKASLKKYNYIKDKIFQGHEYTNSNCPKSLGEALALPPSGP